MVDVPKPVICSEDMTLFISLLKLLVVCVLRSSEQHVDYENVFVGTNETVELNCYHLYPSKCTWRISRTAEPSAMESNATDNMDKTFTVYTEGHLLKPKLKNTNIDIIGGNNSGNCNLKIRSFSAADEGNYTCLPSNLTIHGIISKNGKKVVRGVEGKRLTIVCTVESGKPAATLVLSKNKVSIMKKRRDRITYSFIPTKQENMQSIVCSANSTSLAYPMLHEVQLDIQYSPTVEITRIPSKRKLVLICNPSGNPKNYTFGDWEHWSEFNEHIRNLKGASDGTLTLLRSNNNKGLHETDGIYKCEVSNGIYGTNGNLYQKGTALVHNKVPPIFVNANKPIQIGCYGKKLNLTVLLYNKYGTMETTISKPNKPLYTDIYQESIQTQDIFHDVNVTVFGVKITFQLTLNKAEDFTDYTIKACNEIGCNKLTVEITSEKPVTGNFEIRMSEIIYDIIPNTRYYVRVLSKNKIGESNTTTVITLGLSNNKYDVKAILLVLLVDIAVVLVKAVWEVVLVVLVVVIAITVLTASFHLRRKANNASDIDNPSEEEVRENFQMEPVDNQLYLSSDDPDLAHAQNVRNQSVPNTRLTSSTSQDNQTNQMQLHNHNGANGGRSCTYIKRGVVPSVHNRQEPRKIHELNYSDITFNDAPTMRGAVIHGNVDRTIYSEIDLMAAPVAPLSSSESECDESDENDILFMHM
ncbi:CADM4 [Mytilus edulis]|uniref:CADM4 n=1 Tax=Mytilus edulis TaxID=6550 RepID=A0A8S3SZU1_MYTED|nr:CADM4 [Mytilus edulis]